jgi:hypothetical protein
MSEDFLPVLTPQSVGVASFLQVAGYHAGDYDRSFRFMELIELLHGSMTQFAIYQRDWHGLPDLFIDALQRCVSHDVCLSGIRYSLVQLTNGESAQQPIRWKPCTTTSIP